MQAIEFDAVVRDAAIPLPLPALLATGMPVRVVVMFEGELAANISGPFHDAISMLSSNPLIAPDFEPFSRDQAHER